MTYLTEHIKYSHIDTPRIEADTWAEAESKCPLDQKVIGILVDEIETNINFNLN